MLKNFYIIIILGLIISNLFTTLLLKRLLKDNEVDVDRSQMIFSIADIKSAYAEHFKFVLAEDSLRQLFIKNEEIKKIIQKSDKLLIFISEDDCQSCILQLFMDIDLMIPEISEKNIIIVGNYENESNYNQITSIIPGNYPKLMLKNNIVSVCGLKTPFMFILSRNFDFRYFYSFSNYQKVQEAYLEIIIKNYFLNLQ